MAYRRYRFIGVLFTSLLFCLSCSCAVETLQTDFLSKNEEKRGSLESETVASKDAAPDSHINRRLERQQDEPRSQAKLEFLDDRLSNAVTIPEGELGESNNGISEGACMKSLQADSNLPEEPNSEEEKKSNSELRVEEVQQTLSPQTQPNNALSDPLVLQLLKERKVGELRVEKDIRELWWYLRAQLKALEIELTADSAAAIRTRSMLAEVEERYGALKSHLSRVERLSDDLVHPDWKTVMSQELGELMQRRFQYLQNPPNCSTARKLICNFTNWCGFACQVHHFSYCFIVAYATERMLVLNSQGWQYANEGWGSVFLPLSRTCTAKDAQGKFCVTTCMTTQKK